MIGALRAVAVALALCGLAACITTDDKGVIQKKSQPNLAEAARINADLGLRYAGEGRLDLAQEKLQRALEQNPKLAAAHTGLAFVEQRRGNVAEAESHYRRALELNPRDPGTRNNFGVFLCAQKRPADAERQFLQAAQDTSYGSPAAAWNNAGICARRSNDLGKADRYFQAAVQADPRFTDALAQLASLNLARKQYGVARGYLQRYEALGAATPETLSIGLQLATAVGDAQAASRYQQRLKKEFPGSEETSKLPR